MKIHPALARAASDYEISPHCLEQYQAVFDKCANWFAPDNRHNDEYHKAATMHHLGFLDCRRTSLHRAGRFRGYRIEFKQSEAFAHG